MRILPDIWGEGSLFAFSGLDGPTPFAKSLVGHLAGGRVGVVFPRGGLHSLLFRIEGHSDLKPVAIASDFFQLQLQGGSDPSWHELFVGFSTCDTLIGTTSALAYPVLSSDRPETLRIEKTRTTCGASGGYFALEIREADSGPIRFALAMDADSAEGAAAKALAALEIDGGALLERKRAWFEALPEPPPSLDAAERRTLAKCFSLMKSQVCSPEGVFQQRWTTPDRLPHAMCWLWDSVFHSMGNRYIDLGLAKETLAAVFDMQRPDGCVPISVDPTNSPFVETQPPVLAFGVWDLYKATGDLDLLERHYPALVRYLAWNRENRDRNGDHLYEWLMRENPNATNRCGESGMDNTPRFDDGKAKGSVDFSCYMAREFECMRDMARILGRGDESSAWDAERECVRRAVDTLLWDAEDGFYYDRVVEDGTFYKVRAVSGFLPLFAGLCDAVQASALVRHLTNPAEFWTVAPVPSVAANDPKHEEDMWRGPTWVNLNYLVILGLRRYGCAAEAEALKRATLKMVATWYERDGCIFEYFDSRGLVSPTRLSRKSTEVQPYFAHPRIAVVRDFGWTATLFTALAMEAPIP